MIQFLIKRHRQTIIRAKNDKHIHIACQEMFAVITGEAFMGNYSRLLNLFREYWAVVQEKL